MVSEIAQDVYHRLCCINTTVSESVLHMVGCWIAVVKSVYSVTLPVQDASGPQLMTALHAANLMQVLWDLHVRVNVLVERFTIRWQGFVRGATQHVKHAQNLVQTIVYLVQKI